MRRCVLIFLVVIVFGCSTMTKEYVRDSSKVNEASITNKFTELGFGCSIQSNVIELDGPLNRDAMIVMESNKLQMTYPLNFPKYGDYINQIIVSEKGQPLSLKSHLLYQGLNLLSPGIGWMYLTSDSIFWNGTDYFVSAFYLALDGYCIYQIIQNKQYLFGIIAMAVPRITFAIVSDSFITYDNNILSLGYKIKF